MQKDFLQETLHGRYSLMVLQKYQFLIINTLKHSSFLLKIWRLSNLRFPHINALHSQSTAYPLGKKKWKVVKFEYLFKLRTKCVKNFLDC